MGWVLDPEPDSSPEKDDKSFVVLSNFKSFGYVYDVRFSLLGKFQQVLE